jgi:hypothetical protein
LVKIAITLQVLIEHDLFGKPPNTFPDHAPGSDARWQRCPRHIKG